MITTRTRLLGVSAATLALVAGASAAVSAQPDDDDLSFGRGRSGFGERMELRDPFRDGRGGRLGGLADQFDGLVRQETTYQTDDGLLTRRVDNGTLVSVAENAVEYSLADGQVVSASIDADTEVLAFEEEIVELGRGGLMRRQLSAQSVEPTSIAAGSEILVWAESPGDGTFVAQRLVVQPDVAAADVAAADDAAADDAAADDAAVTEDAAASPAAEASPASA